MSVRRNLLGVGAIACAVLLADRWISARASVSASVVLQSDFFRVYDPVPLLNSFRTGCSSRTGVGTALSSTPGYLLLNDVRNVRYTRRAHTDLCDQSQYPGAVDALHRSTVAALKYFGCRITSDEMVTEQGVRVAYRCGTRSVGIITTGPRVVAGDLPTFVTLQLDEEWEVRNPS